MAVATAVLLMLTLFHLRHLVVVTDVNAKLSWVNAAVSPDEKSTKHWFSQQIEDTIEDGFRIGSDDVATFAEAPCNWVQEPNEDGEAAADEVGPADVRTEGFSVLTGDETDLPGNVKQGDTAEGIIPPL